MAELADAADSKSAGLRPLGVRLPLPAPRLNPSGITLLLELVHRTGCGRLGRNRPQYDSFSPISEGTEEVVGPFELQDFNLYYISCYGYRPSKVAFLAKHAWGQQGRGRVNSRC
jgi:hypothetical protein